MRTLIIRKKAKTGSAEHKALKAQGKTRLGNAKRKGMVEKIPGSNLTRFKKGNPGKAPGTKHAIPQSVKASVKAVLEEVAETEGLTIRRAVMEGLRGGPRNADRYIRMVAEYVDGKPKDTIDLNAKIKDEAAAGSKNRINAKVATMVRNILKKKEREQDPGSSE